jgi:Organic Anion Transporter Polypeptide (OATP) family
MELNAVASQTSMSPAADKTDGGKTTRKEGQAEAESGVDNGTVAAMADAAGSVRRSETSCCCSGVALFVFNVSALLLFWMIGGVYTSGVIRTIERRFGLRSSQTGFLSSCNDIIQTMLVIPVGYFGRRANKPRIVSFTVMFSAVALLLMASPHWLFDSPLPAQQMKATGVSTGDSIFA